MMSRQNDKGYSERENLYRLIISQLSYDGLQSLALQLSSKVNTTQPCPPSNRLNDLVARGEIIELEKKELEVMTGDPTNVRIGIDLEYETDVPSLAPELALYKTCYEASFKGLCHAGAFSADGQLVAAGSYDGSIKILDVSLMLSKSATPAKVAAQKTTPQNMEPVTRTVYNHLQQITCLEFHPTEHFLVSGSQDCTVKFYDYSKLDETCARNTIQDVQEVRCISLHPSGNFILVGTEHPVVRLYDVNTSQCFVSNHPDDQHIATITMIKYSPCGKMYATCSKDGDIKLWDGVSNRCFHTFPLAHDGSEVHSVQFSRNSKYLLTSGKNSNVRLWELSMSRCLIEYSGAESTGRQMCRSQAIFNHTEDYVVFNDEGIYITSWNARNAEIKQPLELSHVETVSCIVHSPTEPSFVTCGYDYKVKFWNKPT